LGRAQGNENYLRERGKKQKKKLGLSRNSCSAIITIVITSGGRGGGG